MQTKMPMPTKMPTEVMYNLLIFWKSAC